MTYQLYTAGDAVRLGVTQDGSQTTPAMAALGDGGAIVTWSSQRDAADATGYDILAQRYDSQGNPTGGVLTLWSGPEDEYSVEPEVIGLSNGGYAVAFVDSGLDQLRVLSFDAAGAQVSDRLVALPDRSVGSYTADVVATGEVTMTAHDNGTYQVTWSAGYAGILAQYTGGATNYTQSFLDDGTALNTLRQVTPWVGTGSYSQDYQNYLYNSAALADGDFVVVYRAGIDSPGNTTGMIGIGVVIRDYEGNVVSGPYVINDGEDGYSGMPAVAALADGSFVVAWGGETDTNWQRFDASGSAIGSGGSLGRFLIDPNVIATEDGGFLITAGHRSTYGPVYTTYGQRYDAEGNAVGDLMVVNHGEYGVSYYRSMPDFVTLGNGQMLGMWEGSSSPILGTGNDILVQAFMAERVGGAGDDVLAAADAGTAMYGGDGADTMVGSAAGDVIEGDAGNDVIAGEEGDDLALGGAGDDLVQGGAGMDVLEGNDGADTLLGGAGDDTLTPGLGDDLVDGGAGVDEIVLGVASGAVTVDGPEGALTLTSGDGVDVIAGVESFVFTDATLSLAEVLALRNLTLAGTDAADTLTGGYGDDLIEGGAGDDSLSGGDGNDTLISGAGQDTLLGGAGDDLLQIAGGGVMQVGAAVLNDLDGAIAFANDWTLAPDANVEAAEARPHLSVQGVGSGQVYEAFSFHAEAGQSWIFDVDGAGFDSYLELYAAGDLTTRIAYNDDAATALGAGGSSTTRDAYLDHAFAEGGDFVIGLRAYGATALTASQGFTLNVSVVGDDGTLVSGSARPGLLLGEAGDDTLEGGAGADSLYGGTGDDSLTGGSGTDTLVGDTGADTLIGGTAQDDLRDLIYGGDGDDYILGGHGNDDLNGGNDNDTIGGGFGTDTVVGNGGDDVLTGEAWSDLIFGNDGNDFVNGGFGYDRLNGGAGADRFYHLGIADHGSDWVQDYTAADGDVLLFGGGAATAGDFIVQFAGTTGAGAAGVTEAFVTYVPTGQILWALVDGGAQDEINVQAAGVVFDLLV